MKDADKHVLPEGPVTTAMPIEMLERRSAAFQKFTQTKGQPLVYGVGKEPLKKTKTKGKKP